MIKSDLIKELELNGIQIKESDYEWAFIFSEDTYISVHYDTISLKTKKTSYLFNSNVFLNSMLKIEEYEKFVRINFNYDNISYTFDYEVVFKEKNNSICVNNLFNNLFTHIRIKSYKIRKKIENNEINF